MDPERKAFYEYYAALMEPWDGPAAIAFTDGRQIGATLDRNGLRPARYVVTDDDHVIMASEAGVLPVPEEKIVRKWRLQPGKMLLIDLEEGRIIDDDEIKQKLAREHPYAEWLKQTQFKLEELPDTEERGQPRPNDPEALLQHQQAFGYTQEDMQFFLEPMGRDGDDPVGSMGTDTPLAVLSDKPKLLFNYFKQNFAQVTNPPIDPIREELVMSLVSIIGPRPNLLGHHAGNHYRLEVSQPILTNADLEKIRDIENLAGGAFRTQTIDTTWPAERRRRGHGASDRAHLPGGDRGGAGRLHHPDPVGPRGRAGSHPDPGAARHGGDASPSDPPGPAHAHRARGRNRRSARSASFLRARRLWRGGDQSLSRVRNAGADPHQTKLAMSAYDVRKNYLKAVGKGIMKVMSKMGISTLPILLRRADLRRGRAVLGVRGQVLHRHGDDDRGRRLQGNRRGSGHPPSQRLWRQPDLPRHAGCRRRLRVPPARRDACLDAGTRSPGCSIRCAATSPPSSMNSPAPSTIRASGC